MVLPFENLSPDPENAFFADGLTDEVIAELSRVQSLRVISRTSAMLFKGAKKTVPTIALAWYSKGLARLKRGDMPEFVRHLRRALELERNSDTLWYLGFALAEGGRTAEARRYADEAIERDPLTWMMPFGRSMVELFDGQLDAAVARFQDWMARFTPDLAFSLWWLAQALAYAGREDQAIEVFERSARSNAGLFSDWCELGARAFRGEREAARAWFESKENLQQAAISDSTYPRYLSMCYARVAEYDPALRWLEQAIRWGFTNHRFLSQHDRFFAPLRGDPRFEALMDRAREKERALEA